MINPIIGQQFGSYRIVKYLGGGGFAEVYLGEHILINNMQAAIKVLTASLTTEDRERFRAEASIMVGLKHANIVRFLDFGIKNMNPFLVMEYAPKGTLRTPPGQKLALPTILPSIKQIGAALQYIHDQHLLHLDIKPDNIFVGQNAEALLGDFGIAMTLLASTSIKEIVGTADYIAPEVIRKQPCAASDQYSLAVTVYEWLCGTCPFQGTSAQIVIQHLNAPPPPLRKFVPAISIEVEEVILRALKKNPTDRYENVAKFVAALETASTQIMTQAGASSPPAPLPAPPIISPIPPTIQLKPGGSPTATVLPLNTPGAASSFPATVKVDPARPASANRSTSNTLSTYRAHSYGAYGLAWSPDSKRIASVGHDAGVHVWTAATGNALFTYRGHTDKVYSVAWSRDGRYLASSDARQTIHIWDATNGQTTSIYKSKGPDEFCAMLPLAWSPDSRFLASGSDDRRVYIRDATSGQIQYVYQGHTSGINALDWSPDGKRIASASSGQRNTLQTWDALSGDHVVIYNDGHPTWGVAWSRDGAHLAVFHRDHIVQIWDTMSSNCISTYGQHNGRIRSVSWSQDSQHVASCGDDGKVYVWEALNGHQRYSYEDHRDTVQVVAWSPDGRYLASGSDDGTVRIWQIT